MILAYLLLLLFSPPSHAQMMSAFVREQVGSLPRGRFLVSMVSMQSSIDQMYSNNGQKGSLSENFNQNITFQKITTEEPIRGNQLAGLFMSNGVALSDSAGDLSGSVKGTVSGRVPLLGYGIQDDLGIYFALPIIEFKINAQYQFKQSTQSVNFLNQLKTSDQSSIAREFETALNTSLENKLYKDNYDWNSTLNKSYIGDLQINLVKVLNNSYDFKSQIQPFIILPTSNDQDLRNLYGLHAGDSRWGLGAKYSIQKLVFNRLQLNSGFAATVLLPTQQGKRLPINPTDQLNELLDPNVSVAGGMSYHTQIQVRYPFPKWVGLNLGMDWQQKFQDSFTGNIYGQQVYQNAEQKTGSYLLTSYASIDFNSIQSFLAGGFLIPAEAELGVGVPISGRNAVAEPVIQMQGTVFF